jgi:hypothetical protein
MSMCGMFSMLVMMGCQPRHAPRANAQRLLVIFINFTFQNIAQGHRAISSFGTSMPT